MKYRESEEMYLETILLIKNQKGTVRAIDIAGELGYAKSSVSRAVGLLVGRGYVVVDEATNEITLTESGTARATEIYERHHAITELLKRLGASDEVAEDNACRIEHVITPEMFEVVKKYLK